jgi:hypothetical protein
MSSSASKGMTSARTEHDGLPSVTLRQNDAPEKASSFSKLGRASLRRCTSTPVVSLLRLFDVWAQLVRRVVAAALGNVSTRQFAALKWSICLATVTTNTRRQSR